MTPKVKRTRNPPRDKLISALPYCFHNYLILRFLGHAIIKFSYQIFGVLCKISQALYRIGKHYLFAIEIALADCGDGLLKTM